MTKVFIGGSRNVSMLSQDIKDKLDDIIRKNIAVIIGDANGADKAVQHYFNENKYENVVIYCMGDNCRNNAGNWPVNLISSKSLIKDFSFYALKDLKMAEDADYGLMIWDAKSKGTINNVLNLIRNNKSALIYFTPERKFYNISNPDDLRGLLSKCDEKDIDVFKKKLHLTHKLIELYGVQQRLISV